MLVAISLATFVFTLLGGLFALRFKDKLHLILGFSAGAVIAVAFFDLIPEAIELGRKAFEVSTITSFTAAGFISYMLLDRFAGMHGHGCDENGCTHHHVRRGKLAAGSLAIHSFLDGVVIGLAFQVSEVVGSVVTVAVLVHDFSDGVNAVNLILKSKGGRKEAVFWLLVDAAAPVIGVLSTLLFTLSETMLAVVLAVFAGSFLYIGASDLLPESHHSHPTKWSSIMTVVGMAVLFAAIKIADL